MTEGTVSIEAATDAMARVAVASGPEVASDGEPVEASAESPVAMEQDESINANDPAQENTDGEAVQETLSMADAIKKHLEANDWKYEEVSSDEDRVLIKTGGKGKNGSYGATLDIKESRSIFIVYVRSQINFPTNSVEKLALFLTRANFGLTCGNFELDMSDGEVRYKNSINVSGSFMSSQMTDAMIHTALGTMDKYFECIVKVAYGVMSPENAIKQIEG